MFAKSRFLVAAAIVLGSASAASAQADAEQMMSYQRSGPVLNITTPSGRNPNHPYDQEQMESYGPIGFSARAQAPQPAVATLPRGGSSNHPYDQEQMESYGVNGAPR
jgi:hypothetical protein